MNSKLLSLLLVSVLILSLGCVTNVFADNTTNTTILYKGTIYVSTNGNDSNDGFTPATSKKTIQNAVYKAPSGCTILVAPGTYTENTITIKKKLKLMGSCAENTTIQSTSDAIVVKADEVLIKGLTITPKEYHSWNRGIWTNHFLTIENCVIKGFKAKSGAGIRHRMSNLVIKNCTIIDNKAICGYGAGISSSKGGSVTITDSMIANNTAKGIIDGAGGAIALFNGNLHVKGSVISGNSAAYGGGIWSHYGSVIIENTIISNNTASLSGGGISHYVKGTLNINNVTFEGNKPDVQDTWVFFDLFYW